MRMGADDQVDRSRSEVPALDVWVKRTLKERYGWVAREPLPADLLEMLSTDAPDC